MTANGYGVSFGSEGNLMVGVQLHEYSKNKNKIKN